MTLPMTTLLACPEAVICIPKKLHFSIADPDNRSFRPIGDIEDVVIKFLLLIVITYKAVRLI